MRNYCPDIFLSGNDENLLGLFASGIKFSTHCNYFINNKQFTMYPHLNNVINTNIPVDLKMLFKFYFIDNHYFIEYGSEDSVKYRPKTTFEFILFGRYTEKYSNTKTLLYIKNADKSFTYTCTIQANNIPCFEIIEFKDIINEEIHAELSNNDYCRSISIYIEELNSSIAKIICKVNHISEDWDLIRSLGINIPLLIVQVLLGRNYCLPNDQYEQHIF